MARKPRGLVWAIGLLTVVALLAGCTGDGGDDGPTDDPSPTSSPSPSPTNTTEDPDPDEEEEEEERERPEVLNFTYGPAGGCEGSLTGEGNCASFQAGPDAPAVDGHWQELDERYWGLRFTTTVDSFGGDSDCYYVGAGGGIRGNGHNGSGPCAGTVPDGTAYLFLYSYVDPHQGMTLQFRL